MEDQQQNPFFIHHSDHPGLVLVSHLLTEENYSSWRRAMLIALRAKNKIGFVDGTVLRPPDGDPQFHLWQRNDNVVASWLLNSVSKELTSSIIYASTASAIWNNLQERFLQNNGPRLFQLRKDFITCTQSNCINIPLSSRRVEDKMIWHLEKDGEYSVRSVYHAIMNSKASKKPSPSRMPCNKL